jgi:hypothetical protein
MPTFVIQDVQFYRAKKRNPNSERSAEKACWSTTSNQKNVSFLQFSLKQLKAKLNPRQQEGK